MSVIACGQDEILGDECVTCGSWLDAITRGGLLGPHGWRFCSLACIDAQVDHEAELENQRHLTVRDLLCACETCQENGVPTQAMRDEHAEYRRAVEGGGPTP